MSKEKCFPDNFIWGVSTAAAQIESASSIDGRGVSNWDEMPRIGAVYQNQTMDDGCDHYHHYKEDIKLMAELGVKAYRFSISWNRILPNGLGKINEKGLQFYDDVIDELLKYGIEPYITLFHWDMPLDLLKEGGWLNNKSSDWFLEYVKVVILRYKSKVKNWITINEPPCMMIFGGVEFGRKYTTKETLQIVHNILLAHGKAARFIKDNNLNVGIAVCSTTYAPIDDKEENIEAARIANFDIIRDDIWGIALWDDPIMLGDYNKKYYEIYTDEERPNITKEDLELISTPLDFYGHNIYHGAPVKTDGKGGYIILNHSVGNPKTCMDWDIYPKIMYWAPKYIYERYHVPFFITENGCAVTDILTSDKRIHDAPRIEYLKQYLANYRKAYEDGVDIRGYFLWSFMDNFEWREGYSKRFGIVYVNYQTKERIKKDSYYYYQEVIKNNREE